MKHSEPEQVCRKCFNVIDAFMQMCAKGGQCEPSPRDEETAPEPTGHLRPLRICDECGLGKSDSHVCNAEAVKRFASESVERRIEVRMQPPEPSPTDEPHSCPKCPCSPDSSNPSCGCWCHHRSEDELSPQLKRCNHGVWLGDHCFKCGSGAVGVCNDPNCKTCAEGRRIDADHKANYGAGGEPLGPELPPYGLTEEDWIEGRRILAAHPDSTGSDACREACLAARERQLLTALAEISRLRSASPERKI